LPHAAASGLRLDAFGRGLRRKGRKARARGGCPLRAVRQKKKKGGEKEEKGAMERAKGPASKTRASAWGRKRKRGEPMHQGLGGSDAQSVLKIACVRCLVEGGGGEKEGRGEISGLPTQAIEQVGRRCSNRGDEKKKKKRKRGEKRQARRIQADTQPARRLRVEARRSEMRGEGKGRTEEKRQECACRSFFSATPLRPCP